MHRSCSSIDAIWHKNGNILSRAFDDRDEAISFCEGLLIDSSNSNIHVFCHEEISFFKEDLKK